jgi:hypothetical protein
MDYKMATNIHTYSSADKKHDMQMEKIISQNLRPRWVLELGFNTLDSESFISTVKGRDTVF